MEEKAFSALVVEEKNGKFTRKIKPKMISDLPEGNLLIKVLGTAGLTAGISVLRLTELVTPADGSIVVSGATGGVGSMSISILKKLGYEISAITGKEEASEYLKNLGADEIIIRNGFMKTGDKPMAKPAFAGGIDAVGGVILQNIIKSIHPMGVVTCCGNAASPELNLTVFPFILRGITLIGIDSQNYPMVYRERVWEKLSAGWKPDSIQSIITEITLEELDEKIDMMLSGELKGRTIINME